MLLAASFFVVASARTLEPVGKHLDEVQRRSSVELLCSLLKGDALGMFHLIRAKSLLKDMSCEAMVVSSGGLTMCKETGSCLEMNPTTRPTRERLPRSVHCKEARCDCKI